MTSLNRTAAPANELPGFILAAAVATFGALVILGPRNPVLLLAAPIGGIGLIFAARRPLLAVTIMVVVEVTNVSGVLAPRLGIPFFPASLLMGLMAVAFALRDPKARSRLNGWTMACAGFLVVFLATQAVATIGSVDMSASLTTMRRAIIDCLFVMLMLLLVQLTARPWVLAVAFVVPLALLSSLTVINELIFGGTMPFGGFAAVAAVTAADQNFATLRYGGPLPDSNFWGRYLVMALPLAAALLTRALRSGRRYAVAMWMPVLAALFAGIYLTQSRGTYATAGIAMAVWFLACERSVRRRGMAVLPLALLAFAVPGVGDRLVQTVVDLSQAQEYYNIDSSTLNRVAAVEMAWKMFEDRPYFGFGPGSFVSETINYAGGVSTATRGSAGAPHNMYAEFAGESGIFGLLGLAVLILGFLTVVVLRIIAKPASSDRVLAAAVCAAIIAYSVASIALHMAYFRAFGVVLALAAGLAPALPLSVDVVPRFLRGVAVWLLAGILGCFAFWLCLSVSSSPSVTATQRATLVPEGPIDGWYAYALDIRSRMELLPTFATILQDTASPVSVTADPVRGVLKLTTTADTASAARDEIQLAAAHAGSALNASIGYLQYSLRTVGGMQIVPSQKRAPFAPVVAGAVGASTGLGAGLALSRMLARLPKYTPSGRSPTEDLVKV
ncbi:O-antigen ligase family protein [Mycobacterium barrassiae]|uniref:O-antigen ligase family protein n=1 Tax=Mycobacterium barrassiae TaxID=319709 RepID=UPI002265AE65|nr:O-antigen ligase family protein [Mycobacterium barrassiae]MCV7303091.1 O-antigen ligase family protein [Mycobacterium barrassiae]